MLVTEIASYLAASGIVPSASVFTYNIPAGQPDDILAVIEYGGMAPQYVMDDPLPSVEQPRFQVVSRSRTHATARLNIEQAYRLLARITNQSISGTWYQSIRPIQGAPIALDRDGDNRVRLVWNFEARKGLSALA